MNHQEGNQRDELRARFTVWLDTTISRAKLNYLKKLERQIQTVSLDEIPESTLLVKDQEQKWLCSCDRQDNFEFEEERVARAFMELPPMRQKILILLFVEEQKPDEIAKKLHCTVQHVYNQRSLALKKLRKLLEKGGDIG